VCDALLEPEDAGVRRVHVLCEKSLKRTGEHVCVHCGRPVLFTSEYCYDCSKKNLAQSFFQGKALFLYQGTMKDVMYRFKYGNRREYALFFAKEAMRRYGDWIHRAGIEAIVPVPMYQKKQKLRGYNQAECFARALSDASGIPLDRNLVKRVKDTQPLKELNDLQRKNNLKTAFHSEKNIVQYKRVLLVDDIYTTGTTADAVAEALQCAGVKNVFFLAICIGKGM